MTLKETAEQILEDKLDRLICLRDELIEKEEIKFRLLAKVATAKIDQEIIDVFDSLENIKGSTENELLTYIKEDKGII